MILNDTLVTSDLSMLTIPDTPVPQQHNHSMIVNTELAQRLDTMRKFQEQVTSSPWAFELLKLSLAVATSLTTPATDRDVPLWLTVVAPPSTGKTSTVNTLLGSQQCYSIDTMTPASFSSAFVDPDPTKKKKPSLLQDIDGRCLIIKDLTTLFSLRGDVLKTTLGALCSIFDGEFTKASGTVGVISIKSCFSLLGCITPAALAEHQSYMNMIGGRFLLYRMAELTRRERDDGFALIDGDQAEQADAKRMLKAAVTDQIEQAIRVKAPVQIEETQRQALQAMAYLIANGRGTIRYGEAQVEAPYRAYKQLLNLARSLARISGHIRIEASNLELVRKVAIGTLPSIRAQMLEILLRHPEGLTIETVIKEGVVERKGASGRLEELTKLGVLVKTKQGKKDCYHAAPDLEGVLLPIAEEPIKKWPKMDGRF